MAFCVLDLLCSICYCLSIWCFVLSISKGSKMNIEDFEEFYESRIASWKDRLKSSGYTQQSLSRITGYTIPYLNMIINCKIRVSYEKFIVIERAISGIEKIKERIMDGAGYNLEQDIDEDTLNKISTFIKLSFSANKKKYDIPKIVNRLREFIKEKNFTQFEISRKLECSDSYISIICNGNRIPSNKMTSKIKKMFDDHGFEFIE